MKRAVKIRYIFDEMYQYTAHQLLFHEERGYDTAFPCYSLTLICKHESFEEREGEENLQLICDLFYIHLSAFDNVLFDSGWQADQGPGLQLHIH